MKLFLTFILIFSSTIAQANNNYSKSYIKMLLVENARKSSYVTPALALAVAKVESSFISNAVSSKGAIGVMQIMPRTALLEFGVSKQDLFNPKTNIKIGVKFLDGLIKKYRGDIGIALSHYNGGSAVGKWPKVKIIPATYPYVLKVLRNSNKLGMETAMSHAGTPVTCIGQLNASHTITTTLNNKPISINTEGFEHFTD